MTKGGFKIVGSSPTPFGVTWGPAADNEAALTVNGMDVLVEGFVFYTANSNCTGIVSEWDGVTAYGENMTVRNCFFDQSLDYGIAMDYTWFCQIYNNYFEGLQVAAIHDLDVNGDPDYAMITGNRFMDCVAAIDLEDNDHCFVHGNLIYGDGTGTNNFIDLTGSGNNVVSDNWLSCTIAQYDVTCSDATSGAWLNNHCIDGDTTANPI